MSQIEEKLNHIVRFLDLGLMKKCFLLLMISMMLIQRSMIYLKNGFFDFLPNLNCNFLLNNFIDYAGFYCCKASLLTLIDLKRLVCFLRNFKGKLKTVFQI